MTVPSRIANGPGNVPDATQLMDNFDYGEAIALGNIVQDGGFESWGGTTTFNSIADSTAFMPFWTYYSEGDTKATVNLTKETSTINSGTSAVKLNITGAGSSNSNIYVRQSNIGATADFSPYAGKTIYAGIAVRCGAQNKVCVKVYDGHTTTVSTYHTGGSTWEVLTLTHTVDADPILLDIYVYVSPSNFTGQVYIDSAFMYVIPPLMSATAKATLLYREEMPRPVIYSQTGLVGIRTRIPQYQLDVTGGGRFTTGLAGVDTNSDAAAGIIGEYLESVVTYANRASAPTSANYGDVTSLTLTAGDWDVTSVTSFQANSATIQECAGGIGTATGHNNAGLSDGYASLNAIIPTAAFNTHAIVPVLRKSIATTTTFYLKVYVLYSAGTPKVWGRISARRMR